MYKVIFIFLFLSFFSCEKNYASSKNKKINVAIFDTLELKLYQKEIGIPSILDEIIKVAKNENDSFALAKAYYLKGKYLIISTFDYPKAFKEIFKGYVIFEELDAKAEMAKSEMQIGVIYFLYRDFPQAREHFQKAFELISQTTDTVRICRLAYLIGLSYSEAKEPKEALKYIRISGINNKFADSKMEHDYGWAKYYLNKGMGDSAIFFLNPIVNIVKEELKKNAISQGISVLMNYNSDLAQAYLLVGDTIEAKKIFNQLIKSGRRHNTEYLFRNTYKSLNTLYRLEKKYELAEKYLKLYVDLNDSLINEKNVFQLNSEATKLNLEHEKRIFLVDKAKSEATITRQKGLKNLFIAITFFILAFVAVLIRNNNQKKKVNKELADSIIKLKDTQTQLVHHEKLASMGRLSAGIAHEMRNPLNFVNGFSEVTSEMLKELEEVTDENERKAIIHSMKDNIFRISEHGKRAEMIVKQMIEHVHTSKGVREVSDINHICDIYLKMVMHTMSLNKVEFNHKIIKKYASDIPLISINQNEIGRALINIFTNAFQAIEEKLNLQSFIPEITITTNYEKKQLKINISDNGIGIKKEHLQKIGEPFFTTKPTGKGAGLGLSVAHDIIRAYGGTIVIDSIPMELTNICICIPV